MVEQNKKKGWFKRYLEQRKERERLEKEPFMFVYDGEVELAQFSSSGGTFSVGPVTFTQAGGSFFVNPAISYEETEKGEMYGHIRALLTPVNGITQVRIDPIIGTKKYNINFLLTNKDVVRIESTLQPKSLLRKFLCNFFRLKGNSGVLEYNVKKIKKINRTLKETVKTEKELVGMIKMAPRIGKFMEEFIEKCKHEKQNLG